MFIDEQIGLDITTSIQQRAWLLKNDTKSTFFIRLTETESTDFGIACQVELKKEKNGINSYGYCFLVAFWYVETKKYLFWSTEIFCWVEFNLKFDPIFHFREFTLFL